MTYEKLAIPNWDIEDGRNNYIYNVDKYYDFLKGTVFIFDYPCGPIYNGYIKIYGDKKLLYSKTDISRGIGFFHFVIDITGVSKIIVSIAADGNGHGNGLQFCVAGIRLLRIESIDQ